MSTKCFAVLLMASTTLGACSPRAGLGGVPVIAKPPRRAVVGLADVVNNIKCDMLEFMKDNDLVTERGRTLGGTLVFTIDRSNTSGGGIKLGIPVVTGVKANAGLDLAETRSFGESVSMPFVMTYRAGATEVDCSSKGKLTYSAPGRTDEVVSLVSPLLDIADLKPALQRIERGNPKVTFADFAFKGSIILTRSKDASVAIDVLFISPSLSQKISSDYKIEYNIGTNWQKILTDAGYTVTSTVTHPRVEQVAVAAATRKPLGRKKAPGSEQSTPPPAVDANSLNGALTPLLQPYRLDVTTDPATGDIRTDQEPAPDPRREQ